MRHVQGNFLGSRSRQPIEDTGFARQNAAATYASEPALFLSPEIKGERGENFVLASLIRPILTHKRELWSIPPYAASYRRIPPLFLDIADVAELEASVHVDQFFDRLGVSRRRGRQLIAEKAKQRRKRVDRVRLEALYIAVRETVAVDHVGDGFLVGADLIDEAVVQSLLRRIDAPVRQLLDFVDRHAASLGNDGDELLVCFVYQRLIDGALFIAHFFGGAAHGLVVAGRDGLRLDAQLFQQLADVDEGTHGHADGAGPAVAVGDDLIAGGRNIVAAGSGLRLHGGVDGPSGELFVFHDFQIKLVRGVDRTARSIHIENQALVVFVVDHGVDGVQQIGVIIGTAAAFVDRALDKDGADVVVAEIGNDLAAAAAADDVADQPVAADRKQDDAQKHQRDDDQRLGPAR